ncbi:MAG: methylenetetrahydrofolate reductase [NAD(P)H] [Lachnospiraceae bacterium]|jgi:methylenetetrahydrofolate reductase (NADPH)|nr:methylenetetrahydrofolate reductase [NAD(P)H] [Lachnospiraceae bacterium]
MRINEILAEKNYSVSFEVFPPKTKDNMETVVTAARKIADLKPAFMSVTYGAGGGTSEYTVEIARQLQEEQGVPMMAHLTCITSDKETVDRQLVLLKEKGIQNILALRGDRPDGFEPTEKNFRHAIELVREIKEFDPNFCIAGACYPETHPEAETQQEDIKYLKEKVDAGMDFLITQMFFDNAAFYSYMYQLREAGIFVPVHPGIMPIVNATQMKRTLKLSGSQLPQRFRRILDTFGSTPECMRQAGIAYATDQIIDLFANGFRTVHVYSMNNPAVASAIMANLSKILEL